MQNYIVTIYDISDIKKPKKLDEVHFEADGKCDAQDKANSISCELHPAVKRMTDLRTA